MTFSRIVIWCQRERRARNGASEDRLHRCGGAEPDLGGWAEGEHTMS